MAKVKIEVFGTDGGRPLKIEIGGKKHQIGYGFHEVDKEFADQILVPYRHAIRLVDEKVEKEIKEKLEAAEKAKAEAEAKAKADAKAEKEAAKKAKEEKEKLEIAETEARKKAKEAKEKKEKAK